MRWPKSRTFGLFACKIWLFVQKIWQFILVHPAKIWFFILKNLQKLTSNLFKILSNFRCQFFAVFWPLTFIYVFYVFIYIYIFIHIPFITNRKYKILTSKGYLNLFLFRCQFLTIFQEQIANFCPNSLNKLPIFHVKIMQNFCSARVMDCITIKILCRLPNFTKKFETFAFWNKFLSSVCTQ